MKNKIFQYLLICKNCPNNSLLYLILSLSWNTIQLYNFYTDSYLSATHTHNTRGDPWSMQKIFTCIKVKKICISFHRLYAFLHIHINQLRLYVLFWGKNTRCCCCRSFIPCLHVSWVRKKIFFIQWMSLQPRLYLCQKCLHVVKYYWGFAYKRTIMLCVYWIRNICVCNAAV